MNQLLRAHPTSALLGFLFACIWLPSIGAAGDSLAAIAARGGDTDRSAHLWPVAFGDSEADVRARMGEPRKHRTHLTVSDVSPAAIFGQRNKIRDSKGRGFSSLEYQTKAGQVRILFLHDQAFRIIVKKAKQPFHHGVRTDLQRADVLSRLGEPADSRTLMHGRQVESWYDLHDGEVEVMVMFQKDKVKVYMEQDIVAAKRAMEWLWSDSDTPPRKATTISRKAE